jgi:lipopolysaccharide exporter
LKRAYLLALAVQALIGIPAGIGMVMVAKELVLVMLGEKWLSSVAYIQVFGIMNILAAINNSGGYLLLALKKAKIAAAFTWLQVVIFLILVELVFPEGNALGVAQSRLAAAILSFLPYSLYISHMLPNIKVRERFSCIWRPLLAAGLMSALLYQFPEYDDVPLGMILFCKVFLGGITYVTWVLILWLLASKPPGSEAFLLSKLRSLKKT